MEIALGSTSQHKIKALKQACDMLRVEHEITPIQISFRKFNQQPVGFEQTLEYARNRALQARQVCPNAFCFGIENGLLRAQGIALDVAVIVVLTPDGEWYSGSSPGMTLPNPHVQEAEKRGFETTTVGKVIAEKLGGDPTDPYPTLTGGKLDRRYIIFCGAYVLLLQLRGLNLL